MKTVFLLILTTVLLSSCIGKEASNFEKKIDPPGITTIGKSDNYSNTPSIESGIPVLGGSVEKNPPQ